MRQHATSKKEGRAQHGHSSNAHSISWDRCRDARAVDRVVVCALTVERQIKAARASVCAGRCRIMEMWTEGYQMDRMVWMLKWVLVLMKSVP